MSNRPAMIVALKAIVIPKLRGSGFKGTFPHFRRIDETKIDLLTFQFDKWGGGFVIEISQCPPTGHNTHWGSHIPPQKVTAHDLHPDARLRLEPGKDSSTDSWFRYEARTCHATAYEVLPFLEQAEEWWQNRPEK